MLIPSFPSYRGPYDVGTTEYEIPVDALSSPAPAPQSDIPLATVQFRVFYPAEDEGDKSKPVYWVPGPQRETASSFAEFLGLPKALSRILTILPSTFQWIKIPAARDASVKPPLPQRRWPVLVFSHGIGGSRNMYSFLLACLASHGLVVFAPEHRDGSSPVSFIRGPRGQSIRVPYKRISHNHDPHVFSQRHAQLRIRTWEMGLVYDSICRLDRGESLSNLAAADGKSLTSKGPDFKSLLDIHSPGSISWAGHSFGAATAIQFVKSVFWGRESGAEDPYISQYVPLYRPDRRSELVSQITPTSPLILLDLWNLPLLGDEARWLWEKPLPCYTIGGPGVVNVAALLSDEFYQWKAGLKATRFALSRRPTITPTDDVENGPRFFYAMKSAHLSHSDVGVLFPWLMKRWRQVEEPERTMHLTIYAILHMLKECGISVQLEKEEANGVEDLLESGTTEICGPEIFGSNIFATDGSIRDWMHIPLSKDSKDTIINTPPKL
ncbi:hypothetical protein AJ80_02049 [Polytolypa hystricis UAMH7299]|uniref:Putative phospholipase n=1 Tax=Polytolypa hystricis (strain UAMH7299) TaxID=1447883 RepID=A0A2B7YRX1_POLH7|nr:hypothetical protein AJ80_02049 [Polytolypa hystricis UAMH7299]